MTAYRGRFAPSPTGPLHFGSLFAAVVSYLDAKANNGCWLVRIEDIDPPRESPEAKAHIKETLLAHGLHWDETVELQSTRHESYDAALDQLISKKLAYHCPCSRKDLNENKGAHRRDCVEGRVDLTSPYAIRFRIQQKNWQWQDWILGTCSEKISEDFVLKRKDGFYAYQLAVVCDDISQNISHVVRGYDLIDSTPMQLALYQALDHKAPIFGHFPIIVNKDKQKLSKQNLASPVDNTIAEVNLKRILQLLNIPLNNGHKSIDQLLALAIAEWDIKRLNKQHTIHPDWL